MNRLTTQDPITISLIADCPTITVHTRKCYKALIDSGAAVSLIRYPTYQFIDDCFKTHIQATTITLNTADILSMTALRMTALHLRIAEFKFTHNFIVCDRLPDTEIIFGIDIQKKFLLSYTGDKEKNCYIQKDHKFLTYTQNCKQKMTIGIVKSTLKIPLRHKSIILVKIKGNSITGPKVCFISDQDSIKGKDANINIVNGIHTSKAEQQLIFWYLIIATNTSHLTKENYIGHLENIDEEDNSQPHENPDAYTTSSVPTKRMMSEQVETDTFEPPHCKLKPNIKTKLFEILKEFYFTIVYLINIIVFIKTAEE